MRTPEPPDRDEREDSPPRLARPKRTTRPPNNYAREQEIDIERKKTHSQQKKALIEQEGSVSATSGGSSAIDENLSITSIVKELIKLRREIRQRDESHKEELRKAKEEFSAALAEVRHELQTLTDTCATPQIHPQACSRDNHDEVLREIQTLREEISVPAPTSFPSYAAIARAPRLSHPNNIRTPPAGNTRPMTLTETLYCTIDTSRMIEENNEKISAGLIRTKIETNVRTMEDHTQWRCRAVTVDPRNSTRIRIACRDEDEHQLVKRVAETKIGEGARVLRDELYPIKVDSVRRAAILDENHNVLAGAAVALGEESETTVAKITWLSSKEAAKPRATKPRATYRRYLLQNASLPENSLTALGCQPIRQLRFIYITSLLCLTCLNYPSTSFPVLEAALTPYPILTVKPATEMSPKEPLSASPARITDPIVPSLAG
jgi:hypothetical protein